MSKNYKILITGAEGFIGRNLTKAVLEKFNPKDVILFVKKGNNKKIKLLKEFIDRKKLNIRKVNLVTKEGLNDIKISANVIFHLAGSTDTSESDHRTNDVGTKNLVDSIDFKNGRSLFIYASTTAIYSGRKDTAKPITVNTKPLPSNEYGRTKLKAENFLIKSCRQGKFRLTVVRLSTVFGSGTRDKGLFITLKEYIKKGSLISRLNWPGLIGLIYVGDVVKILIDISKNNRKRKYPNIIIACTHSLNLAQISEIMHKELKKEYKEINIPSLFWENFSNLKFALPIFEKVLRSPVYNCLWRLDLIVNDTLHCETMGLGKFKSKMFDEAVSELV